MDKLDVSHEGSPLLLESENQQKGSLSSILQVPSDPHSDIKHRRSSCRMSEGRPSFSSSITELTQAGELISGTNSLIRPQSDGITMSDQMDLLVEHVKMLAGEIAFSTSTLKRLEQSANDPDGSQIQIQKLEFDIQEKQRQMRVLEQRIMESGEASMANASLIDMQQTVTRLMSQCNEKSFELEIKSADNRVLQEQLENKCLENKDLQEKVLLLQQQLASAMGDKSVISSALSVPDESLEELRRKIQSQEVENEKLKLGHVQLMEENNGLQAQNQKLGEEASYAKELASAAAVELKNLAGEITKLSLQNERQAKELLVAEEMVYSRGGFVQSGNGGIQKYSGKKIEGLKPSRKGRLGNKTEGGGSMVYHDAEYWSLDPDDPRMELQAMKQREAALEATLAEKELAEEEYKKKFDEAKKRESALENELAGMWVLVAKLKKGDGAAALGTNVHEKLSYGVDTVSNTKSSCLEDQDVFIKDKQIVDDLVKPKYDELNQSAAVEPLVARLKARMQEMKEKERQSLGNANSHVCKVCFEAPTAAVLIPCRHFCLCQPCSLACSECPLCRTKIEDRIITFAS